MTFKENNREIIRELRNELKLTNEAFRKAREIIDVLVLKENNAHAFSLKLIQILYKITSGYEAEDKLKIIEEMLEEIKAETSTAAESGREEK